MGYAPCALCIWQRYPHGIAIAAGLLIFLGLPSLLLLLVGFMASLTTAAIGIFHTGVERDWWEGPATCSGSQDGLSMGAGASLLPSADQTIDVVLCDEVVWAFLSLSMASWNAISSLCIAALWALAIFRARFESSETSAEAGETV